MLGFTTLSESLGGIFSPSNWFATSDTSTESDKTILPLKTKQLEVFDTALLEDDDTLYPLYQGHGHLGYDAESQQYTFSTHYRGKAIEFFGETKDAVYEQLSRARVQDRNWEYVPVDSWEVQDDANTTTYLHRTIESKLVLFSDAKEYHLHVARENSSNYGLRVLDLDTERVKAYVTNEYTSAWSWKITGMKTLLVVKIVQC